MRRGNRIAFGPNREFGQDFPPPVPLNLANVQHLTPCRIILQPSHPGESVRSAENAPDVFQPRVRCRCRFAFSNDKLVCLPLTVCLSFLAAGKILTVRQVILYLLMEETFHFAKKGATNAKPRRAILFVALDFYKIWAVADEL